MVDDFPADEVGEFDEFLIVLSQAVGEGVETVLLTSWSGL